MLASNPNDLDQSNWLLRCDVLLSADGRFCKLMAAVRDGMSKDADAPLMARLGRLNGPDIVARFAPRSRLPSGSRIDGNACSVH